MQNIRDYLTEEEVINILNKYTYGENRIHSKKVANFSLILFNALLAPLKLLKEYEDLLKYSALLHDIGYFIDKKKHHKHTKYIILKDLNFNALPEDLRKVLALITCSHRKSIDEDIIFYPLEEQNEIIKLISILRIADALDHSHKFNISLEKASVSGDTLTLTLKGLEAELILNRVNRKSKLFTDNFNLQVACTIL